MTKSCCHVTSRKKGRQSKGRKSKGRRPSKGRASKGRRPSKGRASKGRRPSRHTHNLGGGSTVSDTRTPSITKKGDNWTRAQRALLYGVGAAGTGALTGAFLGPIRYKLSDLEPGQKLYSEFEAYVDSREKAGNITNLVNEKETFLNAQNKQYAIRNAKVGAGLAAAAAATYGATRSLKADSSKKPSAAKRARRAVMYGVGAAGTGVITGITISREATQNRAMLGLGLGAAAAAGAYGALRDD